MKTIEALKQNEKAFGLMSEEMKAKAKEIDSDYFDIWAGGSWGRVLQDRHLDFNTTYRLRADYTEPEPEAGVEKKTVYPDENELYFEDAGEPCKMSSAVNSKDFIGYLYEGNVVSILPRMYYVPTVGSKNFFANEQDLVGKYAKVLTPTHVLFRKSQ